MAPLQAGLKADPDPVGIFQWITGERMGIRVLSFLGNGRHVRA